MYNNEPSVTVYVPVYNNCKYLKEAMESILSQTYTSFEVLIINDGSKDNAEKIINKYRNYPNVLVVSQMNKGLTVASNIALRLSRGKYIIRLDADDYFDENALSVMVNFLEANPDTALVYPDYYIISEKGEILEIVRKKKILKEIKLLDIPPHGAGTMIRKDVLIEVGGYSEEVKCQDGYDIWLKIMPRYKVSNINLPLFYYRQHPDSLSKNVSKIIQAKQIIERKAAEKLRKKEIKRVAIIPVRTLYPLGKRFALREICDKPLIDYTVEAAVFSECFDKVMVVSEDEVILSYVKKKFGKKCEVIKRPEKLGRINVAIEKTISLALESQKRKNFIPDEFMILYIDTPLRKKEHIIRACDTMCIFNTNMVISVVENLKLIYRHGKYGMELINSRGSCLHLEKEAFFEGNGAILLVRTSVFKKEGLRNKKVGNIIMLPEESVRINTEFDFKVAEMLLRERTR